MHDTHPPSRQARAEAAAWLARLRADDRTRADEEGFHAWLAASPEHGAAFEAVDHAWSLAGGLKVERARPARTTRRKLLMAGLGATIAAGGTFAFLRPGMARVYETDIGEQKHVTLEDGSQLFLDARTRLAVAFTDTSRAVELVHGRANFRVAADSRRPFVVQAVQRRIVANHCNFDVRCEDGKVQVVMIQGEAGVHGGPAAIAPAVLRSGDRLVADGRSDHREKANLNSLLAWQTGSAVFENDTLADAVQEMNLYSAQKLEFADVQVRQLRVSGVYRVGDNAGFARSISRLLPVTVDRQGDRLVLSAADQTR